MKLNHLESLMNLPLNELDFSEPVLTALRKHRIETMGDILIGFHDCATRDGTLMLPSKLDDELGWAVVNEITLLLKAMDLSLEHQYKTGASDWISKIGLSRKLEKKLLNSGIEKLADFIYVMIRKPSSDWPTLEKADLHELAKKFEEMNLSFGVVKVQSYVRDADVPAGTVLDVPDSLSQKLHAAKGDGFTVKELLKLPIGDWFAFLQSYEECQQLAKALEYWKIHAHNRAMLNLKKEDFYKRYTAMDSALNELYLSSEILSSLHDAGITDVKSLVSFSAQELMDHKVIKETELEKIREALLKKRLLLKNDIIIQCIDCNEIIVDNSFDIKRCRCCDAKKKRIEINKENKLSIKLDGPEYNNGASREFALYVDIKNVTKELLVVDFEDFNIVENEKETPLEGWFYQKAILPGCIRTVKEVCETRDFSEEIFWTGNTYVTMVLELNNESQKRVYKFIYEPIDPDEYETAGIWKLDDFYFL